MILKIQMTKVLTESKTILVVALSSLVTVMPAKLKKAMENTVKRKENNSNPLAPN